MTLINLLNIRSPADAADWYRIGAEYVLAVSNGMDFDTNSFETKIDAAYNAMQANETDVSEDVARSVIADLLADAVFSSPFITWMPYWYRIGMTIPVAVLDHQLRSIAQEYATDLEHVSAPTFSAAQDVLVRGNPAYTYVDGFKSQFILADAILHLEWYDHVARESGIHVPGHLISKCRHESVMFYTGQSNELSPEVHRFQQLLFKDVEWVRRLNDVYALDSALFRLWEQQLDHAFRELSN